MAFLTISGAVMLNPSRPMTSELADIERHLAERFPELAVVSLRRLEIGFGSVVVETSDGVIFRIPRHA
jgi:hypothetical protein